MNEIEKRDVFFNSQYWMDLCEGLKQRAIHAHDECSSDKVAAAYYATCIKGQLFDSLFHLLLANYSKGSDSSTLSAVYTEMFDAIEFCDDVFKKNDHLFFTDSNPNLLRRQLSVISFSYIFMNDYEQWQRLASVFRSPHVLIDKFLSLKFTERNISDVNEFKHATVFRSLFDIFDAPNTKRHPLMFKYLKNWEKKVADKTFCGEKTRSNVIDDPLHDEYSAKYLSSPFVGSWAFEVVPLILHFEIDDAEFEQFHFYPKSLVEF